ncbi:MAG: helix-turn-helix transcriptional regulator [Bacteroidales bacterium]|nr:helix-turn-helix transcriptional regulator [Bacteroidales bacterium]
MLKDIRESRGLSQIELAEAADISVRQIQAFEQGYRDINGAKLSTLLALCIVLGCPLYDIITDNDTQSKLMEYERYIDG